MNITPQTKTNKGCQEWATPQWLIDWIENETGPIDLDVCASPKNAKAPRFFTEADDGLKQCWEGMNVFCNPPYKETSKWVNKAIHELSHRPEHHTYIWFLAPASTGTRWFHKAWERGSLRLFKGRVRFEPPPGVKASTPSIDNALFCFGTGINEKRLIGYIE